MLVNKLYPYPFRWQGKKWLWGCPWNQAPVFFSFLFICYLHWKLIEIFCFKNRLFKTKQKNIYWIKIIIDNYFLIFIFNCISSSLLSFYLFIYLFIYFKFYSFISLVQINDCFDDSVVILTFLRTSIFHFIVNWITHTKLPNFFKIKNQINIFTYKCERLTLQNKIFKIFQFNFFSRYCVVIFDLFC